MSWRDRQQLDDDELEELYLWAERNVEPIYDTKPDHFWRNLFWGGVLLGGVMAVAGLAWWRV